MHSPEILFINANQHDQSPSFNAETEYAWLSKYRDEFFMKADIRFAKARTIENFGSELHSRLRSELNAAG